MLLGLALLSRLASRVGLSPIPLYLLAGLAFGKGGILPLVTAKNFISVGAEVGLILLLFMLGLEYSASELITTLRNNVPSGLMDLVLNFTPGAVAGYIFGFGLVGAIVLGGVTYVSSSGIAAKLIYERGGPSGPATRSILATLITEDLVMAIYLPILGFVLVKGDNPGGLGAAAIGVAVVVGAIVLAVKVDVGLSRALFSRSDEALLLTILGVTILVAGAAELFGISAAVAALLLGMMLAGPAAEGAQQLVAPLRDLFAAVFFAFVGLSVDPSAIPPVLIPAAILGVVGAASKYLTGRLAARRAGLDENEGKRVGTTLIARGEFSIAIAGFATTAGVDPDLEALAVTFVLILAVAGPLVVKVTDRREQTSAPAPAS